MSNKFSTSYTPDRHSAAEIIRIIKAQDLEKCTECGCWAPALGLTSSGVCQDCVS